MKLRRIDILGFKSFRTKTSLEIANGVTSIVGPNGCGKSNVVDAIRWSIGSQSPKDLRGRAMEDVIFAGSENHKPMGFAEVSLTMANDGSYVPAEWKQHAEIRITRRLFRTGESEYEINGHRVRLRDIHQLFLGTGVGAKEAYSIIEQGRIGFIVAARPEERRILIEEAAGITRYKFQRRSSERRLEKTQDNLTRVNDVLSEVERQLSALERQAKRAAKWRELSAVKRELEVRAAVDKREQAYRVSSEADARLSAVSHAAESTRVVLATVETRAAQVRSEVQLSEHSLKQATEAAYATRAKRDLVANNITHQERELESARERAIRLRERASEHGEMISQAQRDLQRSERAMDMARREVDTLQEQLDGKGEALATARARESEALREVDGIAARHANEGARAARLEAALESARADVANLTARRDGATEEREEAHRVLDAAARSVTVAAQRTDEAVAAEATERQRLDAARARETAASTASDGARATLREATAEAESADARARLLENMVARGEAYGAGVQSALKAIAGGELQGVGRPVAERLRVEAGAETRLAGAVGPYLEALVADDEQAAQRVVAWALAHEISVSVTWGALTEGAITPWCRAAAPVPDVIAERIARVQFGDNIVGCEDGIHVSHDGRVVSSYPRLARVGATDVGAVDMAALAADLDAAKAYRDEAMSRLPAVQTAEQKARDALDVALRDRAQQLDTLAAAQRRLRDATNALREAEQAHTRNKRGLQIASKQLADLDTRIEAIVLRVTGDEKRRIAAVRDRDIAAQQLAERQEALPAAREALRVMHDAVSELKASMARAAERVSGLSSTCDRLRETIAKSERQSSSLADEQAQLADTVRKLETAIAADRRSLDGLETDASGLEARLRRAQELHDEASTKLLTLEAETHAARKAHQSNAEKVRGAELKAERAKAEMEHADAALREQFQITLAAAREIADGRPFDDAARATLTKVRTQLDRLGAVNPTAEEEFAEAKERFDYLSDQRADLESALEDLRAAIRKMDQTSKELFATTFHEVNSRFKVLFPRLFEGGTARMELTQPDDLLNTGIDVVVSPPGKRLQSMTLLSGGEKALTAVALIFSIFQLKPTPFCILDEVDAPLDDANVARFAEMVREMSATSQFILITHNKRSMEAASTLYGVTMQEPGVSKVVGVRIPGRNDTDESNESKHPETR